MKRVLLILALAICIAACDRQSPAPSGPSTSTSTPTPTPPSSSQILQSVMLSVNADAMRSIGDTAQVTPIGTFADGTSQNVMATCKDWLSDNVGVLTINSGGLITAQGSGAATITTTCQVVAEHPAGVTLPVSASRFVMLTLGPRSSLLARSQLIH
jgi:uncharacterized lipoprotein YajG